LISGNPDTIERPTEAEAIVNAFKEAQRMFRAIATQDEIMDEVRVLVRYAYDNNIGVVQLVKVALGYSQSHTYRLIANCGVKADDGKKIEPEFHIVSKVKLYDEKAIKRYMAAIIKPCPNHNHNPRCEKTTTANHALCWACSLDYMTREEMPDWLLWVVQEDDAEYRKQALEALYHTELIEEAA
jgi:tRNA G26 N,N-dimethylase Trm1